MPGTASKRDNAIGALERKLRGNPNDFPTARKLLAFLDQYLPEIRGLGDYTECQRMLLAECQEADWLDDLLIDGNVAGYYRKWQAVIDATGISTNLPVAHLFLGQTQTAGVAESYCGLRMSLFNNRGVISKFCYDCYKVQLLPLDLMGLIRLYFILRKLELPRDNVRKSLIELREDVAYPYKAYVYCGSEDEAKACQEKLHIIFNELNISNIYCGISHGCSEHGLKYPEFKYSVEGAHRSFERPESWDRIEAEFWSQAEKPASIRKGYNKEGVSIRDVIALRTWIDYAEIIGDESYLLFRDKPSPNKYPHFAERVRKQAQMRKTQIEELRQRLLSAA